MRADPSGLHLTDTSASISTACVLAMRGHWGRPVEPEWQHMLHAVARGCSRCRWLHCGWPHLCKAGSIFWRHHLPLSGGGSGSGSGVSWEWFEMATSDIKCIRQIGWIMSCLASRDIPQMPWQDLAGSSGEALRLHNALRTKPMMASRVEWLGTGRLCRRSLGQSCHSCF